MAAVADAYIGAGRGDVFFFAFDTGREDDVSACEMTRAFATEKDRIKIVAHGENGEIIKAFSQCGKIVATRFHSAVLALKMGIDMYPVIYRDKMKNMLSDVGYTVKGCPIDAVDVEGIKRFVLSKGTSFSLSADILSLAGRHAEILRSVLKESETD